ncbi:MAG: hypothetical protein QXI58_03460 [Candidatus Micrarchaeia archaeon]
MYPLTLITPRKSKIKFGTRHLYVDLPWQAYYFLQLIMRKAIEVELNTEEVKWKWKKFLQDNKAFLTFHNKSLITISLRPISFGWIDEKRKYLRLDVKWDLFIEYLEEKANRLLLEVEKEGNIMKVYKEIWTNFFEIAGKITSP